MGMTKDEFKILVKGMKSIYAQPTFIAGQYAFDVWYGMFKDIPYKAMDMAVKSYMFSKTYPPTPADINAELQKLKTGNASSLPTAEEAFAMVRKATANSNYNSEYEFSKLPKIVQDAVGVPQNLAAWGMMDIGEFETVQKSHFVRIYNALVEREKSEERLPKNIRNVVTAAREHPMLETSPMDSVTAPKMPIAKNNPKG